MKYRELNLGQIEAIVNKLGGRKGVNRFLRGEITVSETERAWREQDDVIYFSVTSNGTTGEEWIERFTNKNSRVSDYVRSMLSSSEFKPTDGVMTEVAVIMGRFFENGYRDTKNIRAEADNRKLTEPNAEVACLIREKFTDEDIGAMGLWWIVVMHESIVSRLLGMDRSGAELVCAFYVNHDAEWVRDYGFAFAVSQT